MEAVFFNYLKFTGDLKLRRRDPQTVIHKNHGEDSDEDSKVTDDLPNLKADIRGHQTQVHSTAHLNALSQRYTRDVENHSYKHTHTHTCKPCTYHQYTKHTHLSTQHTERLALVGK